MSFRKLKKELDRGKKRNLYVFTGDEKEVLRQYIKRVDENVQELQSAEQLWTRLSNSGLFKGQSTYVLHENEEIQKIDIERIVNRLQENTLILVYNSIDRRKKFFRQAGKYITEFNKFDDRQLISYIQSKNPKLTNEMAFIIAKCCNNDIGRVDMELHKLQFVDEVNMEVLSDLIVPHTEDQIFEMIDSVASNNIKRSMDIYYDLIELGESQIKIIALLYIKFKQLFLVQNYYRLPQNEIMERTGLNYGQVKFTRNLVGKFSVSKILKILKEIQKTEVQMKTGQVDIELGTENLILKIFQ